MQSSAAPALTVIILAAGDSKRMKSSRPKVLHSLCGRPLIQYPVAVARALGGKVVLVVGRAADQVRAVVGDAPDLVYVEQTERRGTGHAVLQTRGACRDATGTILVIPGDQPLMSEAMLRGSLPTPNSLLTYWIGPGTKPIGAPVTGSMPV